MLHTDMLLSIIVVPQLNPSFHKICVSSRYCMPKLCCCSISLHAIDLSQDIQETFISDCGNNFFVFDEVFNSFIDNVQTNIQTLNSYN